MRDSRLILFVPDLAATFRGAAGVRFPVLEKFFSRAASRPVVDGMTVLAECFGMSPEQLPPAPLEWLGLTGRRDKSSWWRADPVHLLVDRDQVAMLPRSALGVTQDEARALAATFNEFYANDQLVLETPRPDTWYLRVPQTWRCHTWDPARVEGWAVTEFMPAGPDEDSLKKLMNEVQMLFFEHPVNQERERAGKPAINSLWLWGGGVMPERVARAPARIVSDLLLVQGLAMVGGRRCESLPGSLKSVLSGPDVPVSCSVRHFDVLVACSARHFDGDPGRLEASLFKPCWFRLIRGPVRMLECYLGGQRVYTLSRWAALRFWRRRRPLLTVLGDTDGHVPD